MIQSVLNYKESEYYYFFATQDGKVLFAKTYEEHQANVPGGSSIHRPDRGYHRKYPKFPDFLCHQFPDWQRSGNGH